MPWAKIIQSVEEAKKLVRPISYDYIDLLDSRYNQLRKYTPLLLKSLQFNSNIGAMQPLMEAINILNDMNESGKIRVPDDAPTDFIPARWNKCIFEKDASINRHFYEICVLSELKNKIRSGDVSVVGSKNYKDFDEYLYTKDEWNKDKVHNKKLAVSYSFNEYIEERTESLYDRLKWVELRRPFFCSTMLQMKL